MNGSPRSTCGIVHPAAPAPPFRPRALPRYAPASGWAEGGAVVRAVWQLAWDRIPGGDPGPTVTGIGGGA